VRFRLIPRDNGFYPLFERQAETAVDTAIQLQKLMVSLPIASDRVDTIVAAERAGDEVMRMVRNRLEKSIVTPFDPEDIQALANSLDDVLDEMRAAADFAHLHQLSVPLEGVDDLVALLRKIVEANRTLVGKLSTLHDVHGDLDEIGSLESTADATYRRIMAELFSGRYEALDILKWKDVVEAVERAINAVEDASDVIQAIAVKHA
jgi:predicted phosphate transport protein (TIGR00153 family)